MQLQEKQAFKQQMEKEVLGELVQLLQHMNKFLADLPDGILEQLAKSFTIQNYPLGHVSNPRFPDLIHRTYFMQSLS